MLNLKNIEATSAINENSIENDLLNDSGNSKSSCNIESGIKKNNTLPHSKPEHSSYEFDSELRLKNIKTKKSYKFKSQKEYEKTGKFVKKTIQNIMESQFNLQKIPIPFSGSVRTYIYVSEGILSTPRPKLLLLIQGSGAVRPGIWSRSVCINDSLDTGSMIPFIKYSKENDFELIILNPNKNQSKGKAIPHNENYEEHGIFVWKHIISKLEITEIYIVAHSRGGSLTAKLVNKFWTEAKDKIKAIAFTDTFHGYRGSSEEQIRFFQERTVCWKASKKPLDTFLKMEVVPCVSAGHNKHEYTTGYCQRSVMAFFSDIRNGEKYFFEDLTKSSSCKCSII